MLFRDLKVDSHTVKWKVHCNYVGHYTLCTMQFWELALFSSLCDYN
jgi:hypothetical protein